MLNAVHQLAHIVRHGIHTECVETTVEHMGFDANLIERLTESAHCIVRILACEKINLLESTTISLYSAETAHFYNNRCDTLQLVLTWLELTGTLPHISV